MLARRILGLDVGSHAAKAVELRQTLRGIEVVQLRHLPFDAPTPGVASELRDLVQLYDLPGDYVVVSLAGDRISTRRLEFPFRDRRKVGPAVPFEVEGLVPFPLDEYIIDWEILAEQKGQTQVLATLAPRSEVALLLETLSEAGVSPRIVEAEGLVLSNLSPVFELPGARLLVDVGHRKSTLCLCLDGRVVATRTVPVAGTALTRAVARDRELGEIEAERAKIEEGVIGVRHNTASLEVLDRLAREILRTVGSLEALLPGGMAGLSSVHLLGGSGRLHRLDEFLTDRMGVGVQRLALPDRRDRRGAARRRRPAAVRSRRGPGAARLVARDHAHESASGGPRPAHRLSPGRARDAPHAGAGGRGAAARRGLARHAHDPRCAAGERGRGAGAPAGRRRAARRPARGNHSDAMQEAVRRAERRADTLGVYRGNLSALDILTEISRLVPANLDVVFEELSIERQVIQIKGHSPSFGSVDQLRTQLAQFAPFSEITVGDITADARRGGQNFSVRISLSDESEAS